MKKKFLDLEYMRKAVKEQEAALKVKTGIRAGGDKPPVYPLYSVPLYGVDI